MISEERLASLRPLVPECYAQDDGGREFVRLPKLPVQIGSITRVMDAMLGMTPEGSYLTRLWLSEGIPERPTVHTAQWIQQMIFGVNWHTWSWKDVRGDQPLIVIVRQHLRALQ